MTFVFPLLLAGLLAAGVPIFLHLIARDKPRTLPFPAFRFLIQKHKTNQRKVRLRNLLLLLLRMGLIAALCLALARPRLFQQTWNMSSERPIDAVLLFDTSASMEYQSSDGRTRIDEAKRRALELLAELPEGSRALIVDSAETRAAPKDAWLTMNQARTQIQLLKTRYANQPWTNTLEAVLPLFTEERAPDATATPHVKLLAVFSDRTRGSWDSSKRSKILERVDRIPLPPEGLNALRGLLGPTAEQLRRLRSEIKSSAEREFNEPTLLEAIANIQDQVATHSSEAFTKDESLRKSLVNLRNSTRTLAASLTEIGPLESPSATDFRDQLLENLRGILHATEGVRLIYFDVGIAHSADLAVLSVQPVRDQAPSDWYREGKTVRLEALVRSASKDRMASFQLHVGEVRQTLPAIELKADVPGTLRFEVPAEVKLGPGVHGFEVRAENADLLPWNDHQFLALGVRTKPHVLILADTVVSVDRLKTNLEAIPCSVEVRTGAELTQAIDLRNRAVFLASVAEPSTELWQKLETYVNQGGNLVVFPPGGTFELKAYQTPLAQRVLPGIWKERKGPIDPPLAWDFDAPGVFNHPFMERFGVWKKSGEIAFFVNPRGVFQYLTVEPFASSRPIVSYAGGEKSIAILEGVGKGKQGKTLLFTTPIDAKLDAWNNYGDSFTYFYLALIYQIEEYVVEATEQPALNFTLGSALPRLTFEPANQARQATLRGPDTFETFTLEPGQTEFLWKTPRAPGMYTLETGAEKKSLVLGRFVVRMPPEESDLTPIPDAELNSLFGSDGILSLDRQSSLRDSLRAHWSEPIELFPYLMLGLLLLLVVENWWSNRFYPKEARA